MNKIRKFYSTKRVKKIVLSILAVILIIGGIAFATFYTPVSTSKVNVSITLTSKENKTNTGGIVNADIEVIKDKTVTEKVSMPLNKATTLNTQLEAGKYAIYMTSAPIESDGSTYKIPTKIDNIVISNKDVKSSKTVKIEVMLERIAVADMPKEQLVDVITRISKEAPDKNKALIESLRKRQSTADTSTDKDKQDAKAEDTPKEEAKPSTDNSESTSSSSSGINGGNTSNKHKHSWTANTVTIPEVPAQGYSEIIPAITQDTFFYLFDDGCEIKKKNSNVENEDIMRKHRDEHGFQGQTTIKEQEIITPATTHWVETSPAIPAHQEQDGYKCTCGAYKSR